MAGDAVPYGYFDKLASGVRSGEMSFLFSARAPEREQRNTPLVIDGARKALTLKRDNAVKFGLSRAKHRALLPGLESLIALHDRYGIADDWQHRTLICDGPLVLCYFNSLHSRAFTRRQRMVYGKVVELVRRRALLDHRLAGASACRATLDAALETLGRAAFVLDERGHVLHANALGIAALDHDADLVTRLQSLEPGASAAFESIPIDEPGITPRLLVLSRTADLDEVADVVATELKLGPRTRQVLRCLVKGEPTKTIADRLGIADNTSSTTSPRSTGGSASARASSSSECSQIGSCGRGARRDHSRSRVRRRSSSGRPPRHHHAGRHLGG